MTIKSRRLYKRHSEQRKLEAEKELTPLDYCLMVRNTNLPDVEIAKLLDVNEHTIRRMRLLDYMPTDKALQERIMKVYLEE